jgi:hypothetical protein
MNQGSLLQLLEVGILALTALITVAVGFFVVKQTTRHFRLLRSEHFSERFDSDKMVQVRESVDKQLNAYKAHRQQSTNNDETHGGSQVLMTNGDMRTFANFFQGLGTAFKHKTVDEQYTWDNFGDLVPYYWKQLEEHIIVFREHRKRQTLYQDFQFLAKEMTRLDRKYINDQSQNLRK